MVADHKATYGTVGKLFTHVHEIDGRPYIEGEKDVTDLIEPVIDFLKEPIQVPKEVAACVEDMIKKLEEEAKGEPADVAAGAQDGEGHDAEGGSGAAAAEAAAAVDE